MNWWDILKNAKLSGKAKSKGTTLDSSRIKIKRPKEDCNMKLQEWANKLKNYDLLMKKRFEGNKLLQKHFEIAIDEKLEFANKFYLNQKGEDIYSKHHLHEFVYFFYEPVPEEVACKAIDMLEKSTTTDELYSSPNISTITVKGIEYQIAITNQYTYQRNGTAIQIHENGKPKVILHWENGENTDSGTDEYQRELKGVNDNNVYHLSGYYLAGKFGYSWWK